MTNSEQFYIEIKEKEKRYELFNIPLSDLLYSNVTRTFPEIRRLSEFKKKELYMRAFFRTGELADFMLLRVYDGEDDRNIDTAILNVPARNDLLAQGFALADGRLLPERYLTLAYDSFEQAKRKLWEAFPEIADFSGNSILRMNECTFNRMCKFAENVFDIVE